MLKAFIESMIDLKEKCRKKCTKKGREEEELKKLNGPSPAMKSIQEAFQRMLEEQAKNPFFRNQLKTSQVLPSDL